MCILILSLRVAGTVADGRRRRAVGATRRATVGLSASTRTGGATCISVPLASPVRATPQFERGAHVQQ